MTKLDTWPWSDDESEPPPEEFLNPAPDESDASTSDATRNSYFMTRLVGSNDESQTPPDATRYSAMDPEHFPSITYFKTKLHTFTPRPWSKDIYLNTKLDTYTRRPWANNEPPPPPNESHLEISNWWPYRRNHKFIGALASLTLSAMWILRNRPDKEAVDRKIEAGTPLDGEIYRDVIDLDEMDVEYGKIIVDMVERLMKIYTAGRRKGELDEKVMGIWNDAKLGKVMERVELCGRKLRISPHALRRLLKPPHLQEIKQDQDNDPERKFELPPEMVQEILFRLPFKHIPIYKCVRKPWLNVIESESFVKSHLSNYAPVLVVSKSGRDSNWWSVFKLEDGDGDGDEHKHKPITKFDFPQVSSMQGSANGLLLLKNRLIDYFYVCNPFTREFIELRGPYYCSQYDFYGFGVGNDTGKHKVVHINPKDGCHVYTLETGSSWRCIETTPGIELFNYSSHSAGAFVNGNLYWFVSKRRCPGVVFYICCFDVEKECFSTISAPVQSSRSVLSTLGDCLCVCDFGELERDNVIWLLKEYELDGKCSRHWSQVHVVLKEACNYRSNGDNPFLPIKLYPNGDMLILWDDEFFAYYCNEEGTIKEISWFGKLQDYDYCVNSILLTPNFLSLKRNFGLENVMAI